MENILNEMLMAIAIVSMGLLAGGLMIVTITDIPLFLKLPLQDFVLVHKEIDHYMHPYMPLLSGFALLSALIELWLNHQIWHLLCLVIGIVGIITIVITSERINVPINQKIVQWTLQSPGDQLILMRQKWIHAQYLRTFAGLSSFIFFVIVLLIH